MLPHVRTQHVRTCGLAQSQTPHSIADGLLDQSVHSGSRSSLLRSAFERQVGRRRIFVQTESGNVCDIDLDRADKADVVKRKVQDELCVPTEQCALMLNDHILEKDLSEVRQDFSLLLTRSHRSLQRSSSTPCLSPTFKELREEARHPPFEIMYGKNCSRTVKSLIRETVRAIESGIQPYAESKGMGGAYYFRNRKGEFAAIVKPTDEEPFAPNNPKGYVGQMLGQPGLKRSIRVGETGVREVAAYLLDHNGFANVPPTVLVWATHPVFNVNADMVQREVPMSKICSYQQFVKSDFDASDSGTSNFPISQVHRIGILDVRIFNIDRHSGNILVRKSKCEAAGSATWERSLANDSVVLIPIDHGLCMPETLDDPYFEWLFWPQASQPFSEDERDYIASLDPFKDVQMLIRELPTLRLSSLRILILCTIFLQRGAAYGLTLAEIGGMMSREVEARSELESLCMLAKMEMEAEAFDGSSSPEADLTGEQDEFQFDLDMSHVYEDEARDYFDGESNSLSRRGLRSPLSNGDNGFLHNDASSPLRSFPSPLSNGCSGLPCNGVVFPSPLSSPRMPGGARGGLPALLLKREMHPLDEDSDNPVSPYTPPPMRCSSFQAPSLPFCTAEQQDEKAKVLMSSGSFNGGGAFVSPSLGFPRSVSLSNQPKNHRGQKRYGARRAIGMRGATSAAEMVRKINEGGGTATTPLVFSDMTERSWTNFLEYFEALLPDAFANRKAESGRTLRKLGKSCAF